MGSACPVYADGAWQVFNTYELLEQILLNLDCVQVLQVKRVCSMFRDVVATSPAMRKTLWLDLPKEDDITTVRIFWSHHDGQSAERSQQFRLHPLLRCTHPFIIFGQSVIPSPDRNRVTQGAMVPVASPLKRAKSQTSIDADDQSDSQYRIPDIFKEMPACRPSTELWLTFDPVFESSFCGGAMRFCSKPGSDRHLSVYNVIAKLMEWFRFAALDAGSNDMVFAKLRWINDASESSRDDRCTQRIQ